MVDQAQLVNGVIDDSGGDGLRQDELSQRRHERHRSSRQTEGRHGAGQRVGPAGGVSDQKHRNGGQDEPSHNRYPCRGPGRQRGEEVAKLGVFRAASPCASFRWRGLQDGAEGVDRRGSGPVEVEDHRQQIGEVAGHPEVERQERPQPVVSSELLNADLEDGSGSPQSEKGQPGRPRGAVDRLSEAVEPGGRVGSHKSRAPPLERRLGGGERAGPACGRGAPPHTHSLAWPQRSGRTTVDDTKAALPPSWVLGVRRQRRCAQDGRARIPAAPRSRSNTGGGARRSTQLGGSRGREPPGVALPPSSDRRRRDSLRLVSVRCVKRTHSPGPPAATLVRALERRPTLPDWSDNNIFRKANRGYRKTRKKVICYCVTICPSISRLATPSLPTDHRSPITDYHSMLIGRVRPPRLDHPLRPVPIEGFLRRLAEGAWFPHRELPLCLGGVAEQVVAAHPQLTAIERKRDDNPEGIDHAGQRYERPIWDLQPRRPPPHDLGQGGEHFAMRAVLPPARAPPSPT